MEEVKEYLTTTEQVNFHVKDDQKIMKFCIQASRTFDTECNRRFFPRKETRYYDHPDTSGLYPAYLRARGNIGLYPNVSLRHVNVSMLELDDDLLAPITVTTNNGDTTITSDNYYLMTGENYNYPPYDRLVLKSNSSQTVFLFSGTTQESNSITGLWGYHEKYSGAWALVDTVQSNITSSATSVTVADVDGVDEQGFTPRFQLQQLCRFGTGNDGEMFYIIGRNVDGTQTLNIIRGVNGTTATAQTSTTGIYVYRPQEEIKLAILALATYSYRRPGNIGRPEIDQPIATSTGVIIMPPQLPNEVKLMIDKYKKSPNGNQSLY
jgi:hypothetical protein